MIVLNVLVTACIPRHASRKSDCVHCIALLCSIVPESEQAPFPNMSSMIMTSEVEHTCDLPFFNFGNFGIDIDRRECCPEDRENASNECSNQYLVYCVISQGHT
mmetsp:Transcript_27399/g.53166  ORF Transcript_27399/g.53166 Transcript_27399/m.53166 type:complete len:104 (+) Transcript_27399:187-498(+)